MQLCIMWTSLLHIENVYDHAHLHLYWDITKSTLNKGLGFIKQLTSVGQIQFVQRGSS
jgi:hypothetical protein